MTIKVSIVEDDAKVRNNLARLIDHSEGFACLSQHPTAEDALEQLPKCAPDVVLMDINLPGLSGVDCVRLLKDLLPGTQVIMLTVYENTEHIFNALSGGASGYLLKQTPPPELLSAIRDVNRGGSPMTSHIARKVVASFRQPSRAPAELASLTPREQQVLDHLAKGFLYKEIAEALAISYDTVHAHVRNIYEKLHVRSRGQAVAKHLHHVGTSRAN
jgi:DNA-binding NarL/FixJ family response regulator